MSKKDGTYLIEFYDGRSIVVGNNYKPWWQHALEYIYECYKDPEHGWRYEDVAHALKAVKFSDTQFYDDGGLKWATPQGYNEVIAEVAMKDDRRLITFAEIKFEDSPASRAVLTRKLKEY